jgi:putative sigma-54 modulation protein
MEVIIKSKNIELTPHLKDYAEKKLLSACRFIPALLEKEIEDQEQVGKEVDRVVLEVEIEKVTGEEKGRIFRTEAQMILPGRVIKAEDVSETVKASVDEVKYELKRQVKEYKDKLEESRKRGGQKAKKMRG